MRIKLSAAGGSLKPVEIIKVESPQGVTRRDRTAAPPIAGYGGSQLDESPVRGLNMQKSVRPSCHQLRF